MIRKNLFLKSQNHVRNVRSAVEYFSIVTFSQKVPSWIFDMVLNTPLLEYIELSKFKA